MRICALTMVYRDYWAVSQWYAHYSRHLGAENLFIIAHGQDDWISELCPRAHVITAPRDDLASFDQKRGQMLNAVQAELGKIFDWVIRTDADELICLDPDRFGSLSEMLMSTTAPAVFAMGLNLVELEGDRELADAEPALNARSNAVFSGHYSKAFAVRDRIALMRHGVMVAPADARHFPFELPPGVYLVHLKYANRAALIRANQHREEVASGPERGLPGDAWKHANEEAKQFYVETLTRPVVSWDRGIEKAGRKIGRKPAAAYLKDGVVKARSLQFPFRTILPDWFKTA